MFCCHIIWELKAHSSSSCLLGKRGTIELGSCLGLDFLEKVLKVGGQGVKLAKRALSASERNAELMRPLEGRGEGDEEGEGEVRFKEEFRATNFLAMIREF